MPRAQYSIRTLFWVTLVVAAFLGGMAAQHQITVLQATKREKVLEREVRVLRAEIRRRTEDVRHYEFRIKQMQKQQAEATK